MSALDDDGSQVFEFLPDEGYTEQQAYELLSGQPVTASGWNEADHLRDADGKFTDVPGSGLVSDYGKISEGLANAAHHTPLTIYAGRGAAMNTMLRDAGGDLNELKPLGVSGHVYKDPKRAAAEIKAIDEVIKDSRLKQDSQTIRGIKNIRDIFGDKADGDLTGFEYTDHGFVSTTASQTSLDYLKDRYLGQGANPGHVTLKVPAGTRAAAAWQKIEEIMLDRGLTYRVTADHGVDANGVRQLEMEVVA